MYTQEHSESRPEYTRCMPCPLTLTSFSLCEEEHQLEAVHLLLVLHTDNNTDGNKTRDIFRYSFVRLPLDHAVALWK